MNAGHAGAKHVVPFPSEWHAPFIEAAARGAGLELDMAFESGEDVIMRGLSLVNNDACYSSLIAAAQAVRALERLRAEDPAAQAVVEHLVFCPGCRAQDAPYLIERALANAGIADVVVRDALPAVFSGPHALDDGAQAHLAEGVVVGDVLLQLRCRFSPYYQAHERHYLDALIATWRKHALGLLASKETLDAKRYLADVDREARVLLTRPRQSNPQVGVAGSPWAVFCKGVNGLLVAVSIGAAVLRAARSRSFVRFPRSHRRAVRVSGGLGGADSELPCVCRSEARGHALRSRIPLLRFRLVACGLGGLSSGVGRRRHRVREHVRLPVGPCRRAGRDARSARCMPGRQHSVN